MDSINLKKCLTENLEPRIRKHLKNVYATFTLASLAAAAGGYIYMFSTLLEAGLMTRLGAIGILIWLMMTPYNEKNQIKRLTLFGSLAFLIGYNLGPLLDIAVRVNPALIMQTLLGTSVVFACFSLAALLAPRGQYLYLGGILTSCLFTLFWLSMMNLFFGSRLLFQVSFKH